MLSMVRIFPRAADQAKNISHEDLIQPNTLPREKGTIMRNKTVERSNVKQPSLGRSPGKFIFTSPSHNLK
jgi:hypothetical protein